MSDAHSNQSMSTTTNPKDLLQIPFAMARSVSDVGTRRPFFYDTDPALAAARNRRQNPIVVTQDDINSDDFASNADFAFNSDEFTWREVTDLLGEYATESFASKEDAPLFSPTRYETKVRLNRAKGLPYKGFRNEHNATTSALIVLDVEPVAKCREPDPGSLF